ncbi:MAG: nucleotide sugar dehydrogenase [Anaerolineae bacterium]|nr:nucleotide sugar dehydrogenase [Anaerolineae bacterium]
MTHKQELLNKFNNRTATVGIVGLGYVGLPLAVEFAEAGYTVIGVDVDAGKVEKLNAGNSYIEDIPTERLRRVVDSGKLRGSTTYEPLLEADAISICVPTPLRGAHEPDLRYVEAAIASIREIAHAGLLVILESTTYPGTTEEIIRPQLDSTEHIIGEDIFLAFSGERIDPGNQKYHLRNTPKVIGGITPDCSELTQALYRAAVDTVVPVSSPTTAEMVKLWENTFRSVNIGLANEMAVMCDKLGLNVWEVIEAAKTKPFGFMPFYPGPGVGGHCIPLDPHYLGWKMRTLNYTARFIELAGEINSNMPQYVVNKIAQALNQHTKPIRGSRVVLLGVAYKPDIDDVRESPALHILELLQQQGAEIAYSDPHVPSLRLEDGSTLQDCGFSPQILREADCVVITTNHSDMDWQAVLEHSPLIVDTRNALGDQRDNPKVIGL